MLDVTKGLVYLRDNSWYKTENVFKMGISKYLRGRDNTYITGEVERGEFIYIIEVPVEVLKIIDKCLKCYFKKYNIYKGGGTEFYDRSIINLIELYFQQMNMLERVFQLQLDHHQFLYGYSPYH